MKQKMKTKYIVGVISLIAAAALVYYFVKKNNDKGSAGLTKEEREEMWEEMRKAKPLTVRPSEAVEKQMQNSLAVNI